MNKELVKEILDVLVDVVNQSCQVEYKDKTSYVDNMALSAYEDAFYLLEKLGLLRRMKGRKAILDFDTDKVMEEHFK